MDHHCVDHRRGGVCRPAGGEGVSGAEGIGAGDDDGRGVIIIRGENVPKKQQQKSIIEIPMLYIYLPLGAKNSRSNLNSTQLYYKSTIMKNKNLQTKHTFIPPKAKSPTFRINNNIYGFPTIHKPQIPPFVASLQRTRPRIRCNARVPRPPRS